MSDGTVIRQATELDREAIADLNLRAFGRPDEAALITELSKAGDVLLQLVAEMDGQVAGHILFYPLGVYNKLGAVGLGPMCVDPWVRKEGIGGALVRNGLMAMKNSGAPIVFVLGHADYYPRFGFSTEAASEFATPVKGPNLMAIRLRFGPPMSGRLIFPDAFGIPNIV
jgi:putative acetyltransferase